MSEDSLSTFTNIEEIPQILHLPKIVLIYENRPHRFRSFPIPIYPTLISPPSPGTRNEEGGKDGEDSPLS